LHRYERRVVQGRTSSGAAYCRAAHRGPADAEPVERPAHRDQQSGGSAASPRCGGGGESTQLARSVEAARHAGPMRLRERSAPRRTGRGVRPDSVVRLDRRPTCVVDAKAPFDAYLTAMEARDGAAGTPSLGPGRQEPAAPCGRARRQGTGPRSTPEPGSPGPVRARRPSWTQPACATPTCRAPVQSATSCGHTRPHSSRATHRRLLVAPRRPRPQASACTTRRPRNYERCPPWRSPSKGNSRAARSRLQPRRWARSSRGTGQLPGGWPSWWSDDEWSSGAGGRLAAGCPVPELRRGRRHAARR